MVPLRGLTVCGSFFLYLRTLPYARVSGIHIGVRRHVGGGVLTEVTLSLGINNRLRVYGLI